MSLESVHVVTLYTASMSSTAVCKQKNRTYMENLTGFVYGSCMYMYLPHIVPSSRPNAVYTLAAIFWHFEIQQIASTLLPWRPLQSANTWKHLWWDYCSPCTGVAQTCMCMIVQSCIPIRHIVVFSRPHTVFALLIFSLFNSTDSLHTVSPTSIGVGKRIETALVGTAAKSFCLLLEWCACTCTQFWSGLLHDHTPSSLCWLFSLLLFFWQTRWPHALWFMNDETSLEIKEIAGKNHVPTTTTLALLHSNFS